MSIIDSIQLSGVTYQIQGGGGGKAIEAGTNISVTTGETADTINCTLNISNGTGGLSIKSLGATSASANHAAAFGQNTKATNTFAFAEGWGTTASGSRSHAEGDQTIARGGQSHAEGTLTNAIADHSHSEGYASSATSRVTTMVGITTPYGWNTRHSEGYATIADNGCTHTEGLSTKALNVAEHSSGAYNVSYTASTNWGDSGNTLFSVGNGTSNNARHNAFEIRQNGDIYLSSGGTDIKLQDHLGGGSITIDPSLDSGSTNAVANSAITNAFTAVNDNISELSANSVTNCSNVEIVSSAPTPPSIIADGYVKVTWEDDYTQTYIVDYSGNIGDFDTHYNSNITKVEFGISRVEINSYNFGFSNDDCYSLKTAIFNGDVNLEYITFDSAYQLEGVYFYAPNPSGITGVDEYFLNSVYEGCQTYETSAATYPIYVADLAAYSGAVLCYSYDLGRNITWGEHFGNRLQEIPSGKKFVYNDFVAYSATTDAALSGKQNTLVSGTNIKTINNESLLGSGNIDIQGGGSSYTAGDGIDITNDVISVTGKADTSAVTSVSDSLTAHTANTTVHTTAAEKTSWNGAVTNASNAVTALGGLSLVKLSQSEYDALAPDYDSNTLYVIVN